MNLSQYAVDIPIKKQDVFSKQLFLMFKEKHYKMTETNIHQKNNPLHGITLETILTDLVKYYGWRGLYNIIEVRCFYNDPSMKSSLKFLRHTPWAREKIEKLYLDMQWHFENDKTGKFVNR